MSALRRPLLVGNIGFQDVGGSRDAAGATAPSVLRFQRGSAFASSATADALSSEPPCERRAHLFHDAGIELSNLSLESIAGGLPSFIASQSSERRFGRAENLAFRAVRLQGKRNRPAPDHLAEQQPDHFARRGADFLRHKLGLLDQGAVILHAG
jgi:hypothetical protein